MSDTFDPDRPIPLSRHQSIVRSIYKDFESGDRLLAVITGRQDPDGHRYSGERCVWCGVNYLDHMIYAGGDLETEQGCTINSDGGTCPEPCVGPAEGEWDDNWWPLDKVDAVVKESRGW